MLYYFSYGSNMSPRQMARRCPGAQPVGRGFLPEWQYMTTTSGVANIRPDADRVVHGVLWRCSRDHIASLDRFEGLRLKHYMRKRIKVRTPDNGDHSAIIYISERSHPGIARVDYMLSAVLPGAEAFQLPSDYISELRGWMPRHHIGKGIQYYGRKVKPVKAA